MINPWVIVVALLTLIASFALGGYTGYRIASGACASAEVRRQKIVEEVRAANDSLADRVAMETAAAIGDIRVENRTINQKVVHEREIHREVLQNPDCAIPVSTVRVLNAARGVRPDDRPSPGGTSPTLSAPGRP